MTLKRKASFSSTPSPNRNSTTMLSGGIVPMVDENPRHLNSRTRKRFRNDRPDDQTVYDNTLRWLFTAQQNPAASAPASMEAESETPPPLSSTTIDPSQQSLRNFFQPASASHTNPQQLSNMGNGANSFHNGGMVQADGMDLVMCTEDTSASSSGYGAMDVEMDMEIDMNGGHGMAPTGHPSEKTWVGGIGWI